ncbi:MAG: hypothetical protein ACI3XZ_00245 [Butyricicoccus sp.]
MHFTGVIQYPDTCQDTGLFQRTIRKKYDIKIKTVLRRKSRENRINFLKNDQKQNCESQIKAVFPAGPSFVRFHKNAGKTVGMHNFLQNPIDKLSCRAYNATCQQKPERKEACRAEFSPQQVSFLFSGSLAAVRWTWIGKSKGAFSKPETGMLRALFF